MSTAKGHAARLMGISPRALSHYLAKYPSIDRDRAQPWVREDARQQSQRSVKRFRGHLRLIVRRSL